MPYCELDSNQRSHHLKYIVYNTPINLHVPHLTFELLARLAKFISSNATDVRVFSVRI